MHAAVVGEGTTVNVPVYFTVLPATMFASANVKVNVGTPPEVGVAENVVFADPFGLTNPIFVVMNGPVDATEGALPDELLQAGSVSAKSAAPIARYSRMN